MIPTTLWLLLCLQIVLGTFDMLFHHELTERLAWRRSQRRELFLHGMRNLFYAVLFAGLGLVEVHGALAWVAVGILVLELLITLKDFVEEDRSRKLPASERITHTLLALNYGAILAYLLPILVVWSDQPTAMVGADRGLWGYFMLLSAAGVSVFAVRDLAAARRLGRMQARPAATLIPKVLPKQSVLIAGGTGFIGSRLANALIACGHRVTVLTRRFENAVGLDAPVRVVTDLSQIANDEPIDAIVNLAGEPIAAWLWTARRRRKLLRSRLKTTRKLVALVARLDRRPACFVSGSAIGIYGANADAVADEHTRIGDDGSFAYRLCAAWEAEALKMERLGVRTVLLRTGIVLDTEGGSLGQMLVPFEFCAGGPFGDGGHWMSWITRDDLVRLIGHCLGEPALRGAVNGVAPNPVRNRDFAAALGRALRRPAVIPVPAFVLETALGDLAREIFLGSQNLRPTKALENGFRFDAPDLDVALKELVGTQPARAREHSTLWDRRFRGAGRA